MWRCDKWEESSGRGSVINGRSVNSGCGSVINGRSVNSGCGSVMNGRSLKAGRGSVCPQVSSLQYEMLLLTDSIAKEGGCWELRLRCGESESWGGPTASPGGVPPPHHLALTLHTQCFRAVWNHLEV